MHSHPSLPSLTVSNLLPSWDAAEHEGGGSFAPASAANVVERAVAPELARGPRLQRPSADAHRPAATVPMHPAAAVQAAPRTGHVEHAQVTEHVRSVEVRESFESSDRRVDHAQLLLDDEGLPDVDYDLLGRRDIARELLRARLVALAEQRERRSAYEIAFILLAAAVAVLLAAPPLEHVLLAARGIEG